MFNNNIKETIIAIGELSSRVMKLSSQILNDKSHIPMKHINEDFNLRAFDTKEELDSYSFKHSKQDINNIRSIPIRYTVKFIKDNEGRYLFLAYANLEGADLAGVNLMGANLKGANLKGANLERVTLYDANLYKANLEGANLYDAYLTKANLTKANLKGANLYNVFLGEANLTEANLEGANLEWTYFYETNLTEANLKRAYLERAYLERANFTKAILVEANLKRTHLKDANFCEADLSYANLSCLDFMGTYAGQEAIYINFTRANLFFTSFRYSNVTGADFTGANTINAIGLNIVKEEVESIS